MSRHSRLLLLSALSGMVADVNVASQSSAPIPTGAKPRDPRTPRIPNSTPTRLAKDCRQARRLRKRMAEPTPPSPQKGR